MKRIIISKKGSELTLNTIIISALVLIVLFVMIFMIYKYIIKTDITPPLINETQRLSCCSIYCNDQRVTKECANIIDDCSCNLPVRGQNQNKQTST